MSFNGRGTSVFCTGKIVGVWIWVANTIGVGIWVVWTGIWVVEPKIGTWERGWDDSGAIGRPVELVAYWAMNSMDASLQLWYKDRKSKQLKKKERKKKFESVRLKVNEFYLHLLVCVYIYNINKGLLK